MISNLKANGTEKGYGVRDWDYFAIAAAAECIVVQLAWLLRLHLQDGNVLNNSSEILSDGAGESFNFAFCTASFMTPPGPRVRIAS